MKIERLPKKCTTLGLVRDYGTMVAVVRLECGMSQLELAKALGKKTVTYISLIESGKRKLSADTLEKICEICDTDIIHFLNFPLNLKTKLVI